MSYVATVNGVEVMLENGQAVVDGVVVATVKMAYKHGYHPAICVETEDGSVEWVELDASDRLLECCKAVVNLLVDA